MWSPLNITTHYTPCVGLSKPETILQKCIEYGYKSCAITDNSTLSGSVAFHAEAKSKGIKPIIGTNLGGIIFLAKNKAGWKNLIKMASNDNIFDYKEDNSVIAIAPRTSDEESINTIKGMFGEDFYFQDDVGAESRCLYPDVADFTDYRILVSADLGIPLSEEKKYPKDKLELLHGQWQLITKELSQNFNSDIVKKNEEIVGKCEDYEITGGLNLPSFTTPPEFATQYDYLVHLCRQGWKNKVHGRGLEETIYADRVKRELSVIQRVGLEGYFLIVQDYVNWAKAQEGWLVSPGRGSSAGSLVSHLLNITNVDPIKYNLIFERFYNDGRNTKDKKALPDIDTDFPKFKREEVIKYITDKYGKDKVGHIVTNSELKGKSSIKEVLRANKAVSNDEMNSITAYIPSKEDISDLLADSNESSILRWTLNNEPDILKDWVSIDENGKVHGELAMYFEQAIRLEGTFVGTGKHASGIIISKEPLEECCPMATDKHGEKLAGLDMSDLEKAGFVKFDILGVAVLDKLMGINNLLQYGRINK
jgi:DNA polymerase-3 subunit alpha